MLTYKGENVQLVKSFKSLGIGVPATNKWSVCCESKLQAGEEIIICWKINATRVIFVDGK